LDFPLEQAKQTAVAVLAAGERGVGQSEPDLNRFSQDSRVSLFEPVDDPSMKRVALSYEWGTYHFYPDGSLALFSRFDTLSEVEKGVPLDHARIAELIARYYRAAGYRRDVRVKRVHPTKDTLERAVLAVEADELWEGIPIGGITISLRPVTGRLQGVSVTRQIAPPDHGRNVAVVGEPIAGDAMMASLFSVTNTPEAQFEERPQLRVMLPRASDGLLVDNLAPAHRAAAERGQGILVYYARVADRSSWWDRYGGYVRQYHVWADARTGQVFRLRSAGTPGGSFTTRDRSLARLDLGPAEMTLVGPKRLTVRSAKVVAASAPSEESNGVALTLNVDKVWMPVRFSLKSGLLWFERGGKRVYGKPNKPLLAALRKLAERAKTASG
jgi:hypothetical protein